MPNREADTAPPFFKATRPDSTDFHTGKVRYEVGKRVYPLPHEGDRWFCGPGLLHASTVPTETVVRGQWPCRLFEVTGKPRAEKGYKRGFSELQVIRELPAHEVFGPQGAEVAALIERAGRLTGREVKELHTTKVVAGVAAWDLPWVAAWDAARALAKAAARDVAAATAWDAAWYAARDTAVARYATLSAAWYAATRVVAWYITRDATWHPRWDAATSAASAAAALVCRDLITTEQFDLLYGSWRSVVDEGAVRDA